MAKKIERQREMEKRLEYLKAFSEMARRLAHEIRNPLTPIRLSAEKIERNLGEDGRGIMESVRLIKEQANDLEIMVREFSRFSRLPVPQLREEDINTLFSSLAIYLREQFPMIEFENNLDAEGRVQVDPLTLRQVFSNLARNSVEAMGGTGKIFFRSYIDGDDVVTEFEDTGPGIGADMRERIFMPYFSTKSKGSGLGLAVCQKIIAEHGGYMEVTEGRRGPESGRGARFFISFPLSDKNGGSL